MEFYFINLVYFIIIIPIVLITFFIILKINEKQNPLLIIIILSILLFIIRIILVFFEYTIGIMPYLKEDVIFYSLLTIFGVLATILYVKKVEKKSFEDIGWKLKNLKKNIIFGLLSFIPLLLMIPILLYLTNYQISLNISWEKLILGIEFGLILGGFYEETMFRGVIQNHLMSLTGNNKAILLTASIFTATHIGYLPFIGYGIIYIFVFLMALLLSILRSKLNQISCFILHGGIVFIFIIFI